MRRRSSVKRCLLCLAYCTSGNEEEIFDRELSSPPPPPPPPQQQQQLNIAGVDNCPQLHRHLENVFVLRRILEVPGVWCEEALKEECAQGADQDNGPAKWFSVCCQCISTSVKQAWRIYQQILALEVQMLEIRQNVKRRMKEELLKRNKKGTGYQHHQLASGGSKLEEKIRNFIFPELILTKVEKMDEWISGFDAYFEQDENDFDEDFLFECFSNSSDSLFKDEDLDELEGTSPTEFPFNLFSETTGGEEQKQVRKRRGRKKKYNVAYRLAAKESAKSDRSRNGKAKKWHCCKDRKCRTRFLTAEELKLHYQAHKEQEKRLREAEGNWKKGELDCPHCPYPAHSHAELKSHIQNRHRRTHRPYYFSCPNCNFTVQDDFPRLKDHFDNEHPPLPADIEGEEAPDDEVLASELPVMCPVCSKRCETLKSFTIHQKSMHPEQMGIQVENLECSQCGVKFRTKLDLQSHINIKHVYPKKANRSKFVCDECGKGFAFLSKLEYHQIKHVNKSKREFVCHLCGLDYAYKWILDKHYNNVHGGSAEEASSASADPLLSTASTATSKEEKKIKCRYCNFSCAIKGVLLRHVQQHKQEMGFKCEQCGKSYVNEPGLKRHLKINHALVKKQVPCPHCLKTFVSHDYMMDHVRMYCKVKKLSDPTHSAGSSSSSAAKTSSNFKFDEPIFLSMPTLIGGSDDDDGGGGGCRDAMLASQSHHQH